MKTVLAFILFGLASCGSPAALVLPDLFSDHALLQRSEKTALWGSASAGDKITVTLGSAATKETVADASGKWKVDLDLRTSPNGPFDLTVKGTSDSLVIHDVVVGDVWVCSGQSNMEFKLSQCIDGADEISKSANPMLRCFTPARQAVAIPAANLPGKWTVADPATSGSFSAVAYYFAKTVQASQKIPIGLINTSWGGTPAEAWISAEGLDRNPELKPRKDEILAERPQSDAKLKQFEEDFVRWATQYQRLDQAPEDAARFAAPDVSPADWKTVTLPGSLKEAGLPDNGIVWLRREIDIAPNRAGTYLPLLMGTLRDFETVYWNGQQIGETSPTKSTSMNPDLTSTTNRRYDAPSHLVKPGKNILAIRLFSPGGNARLDANRFSAGWNISLSGPWQAKVEREFPPLSAEAAASYPHRPPWPSMPHYTATYLYNGMLYPLAQLSLRGVIWYQGEANVGRAHQYRDTFSLLIQDWRQQLHRGNLPFYFCQLANFQAKKSQPTDSAWAELRDAQAQALSLPETGMAVLIDIGEEEDIHFRNKKDAGERLAAVALAKTYGQSNTILSAMVQSSKIEGDKIRILFSPVDAKLTAKKLPATYQPKSSFAATKPLALPSPESDVQGFAICGEDGAWKWANAKIDGSTVIVSSPEVPAPKFVRYAWSDNPTCNLYNDENTPVAPFRTDAFPDSTEKAKF